MLHKKVSLVLRIIVCALILMIIGCTNKESTSIMLYEADALLQAEPAAALDTLRLIDPALLKGHDKAYYGLLYTIAMHKNGIPFTSDSIIALSREWYEIHDSDFHGLARSLFYHGLVKSRLSSQDTAGYQLMRKSVNLLEEKKVQDDRLKALAYAYLARANDSFINNLQEAANYYEKAIEIENRLGNTRNLIIDQGSLLVCLVEMNKHAEAVLLKKMLDSTMASSPELKLENPNNAKAIYFFYSAKNLDSALFYCKQWNPNPNDIAAKENMIANIYAEQGHMDSAIVYKKASYEHRRPEDTASYHIYFKNISDYYGDLGQTDSSAFYARLAYGALHDSFERRTEKRVLELEKQYDLTAKDAALEKARNQRNFLTLIAIVFILLSAGSIGVLYARHRKLVAERLTRSVIQAAAKTHQNTLSQLRELRKKPKSRTVQSLQEDIGEITRDIQRGFSKNFSDALENNLDLLPISTRKAAAKLSGERAKIVFILSEMGYTDAEIAEYTCTSVDSVRVMINNNRKIILSGEAQPDQPDVS